MTAADPDDEYAPDRAVAAIVTGLKAVLVGQHPFLQSAALAEALALWLAGHPDYQREEFLAMHVAHVERLVPVLEREVFAGGQHPLNVGASNADEH